MQKAYFYVCGDAANMAREVNTVLGKIISEQRGIPESKAEDVVKSMRSANQYQVCYTFLSTLSTASPSCLPLYEATWVVNCHDKRASLNLITCRTAFNMSSLLCTNLN